jgi:hypothetical protein
MANYAVHVGGGIIGSTMFTAASYFTGLLDFYSVPLLFGAGVLGSIFPDVDSDHGTPIKVIFRVLTLLIVLGFLYLFEVDKTLFEYGWLTTICIIALIYIIINLVLKYLFRKVTRHRGIFHSILAIVVLAGALIVILHSVYTISAKTACFTGVSFAFGYLIHLFLDEIYSVDFANNKVKASHGTALKLADLDGGLLGLTKTLLFVAIFYYWVYPNVPNPVIADITKVGLAVPATDLNTKKLKFFSYETPGVLVKSIRFFPKDDKLDKSLLLIDSWITSVIQYVTQHRKH